MAERGAAVCHRVVGRLAPVLGEAGVQAMLERSLRLAGRTRPWLNTAGLTLGGQRPFADRLGDSLSQQESDVAEEGLIALFAAFGTLLETFVGAALAARLLDEPHGEAEEEPV